MNDEINPNPQLKITFQTKKIYLQMLKTMYLDNISKMFQFRRESQPQHLKRWFFLKNRPINFHTNSTSVTRLVKRNQLSFSSIEINKPLPDPVCIVSQIRFKIRSQFQFSIIYYIYSFRNGEVITFTHYFCQIISE